MPRRAATDSRVTAKRFIASGLPSVTSRRTVVAKNWTNLGTPSRGRQRLCRNRVGRVTPARPRNDRGRQRRNRGTSNCVTMRGLGHGTGAPSSLPRPPAPRFPPAVGLAVRLPHGQPDAGGGAELARLPADGLAPGPGAGGPDPGPPGDRVLAVGRDRG